MEAWLNDLLCLNAAEHIPKPPPQLPHPSDCELYFVERDTLFSYHKVRSIVLSPHISNKQERRTEHFLDCNVHSWRNLHLPQFVPGTIHSDQAVVH